MEYGVTTAYGSVTAVSASLVTAHTASIASLSGGTIYHYRVKSKDGSGNSAISEDNTLTTIAPPPPPPAGSGYTWLRKFGGSGCDFVSGSATDNAGNTYAAGLMVANTSDCNPTTKDAWLVKYDTDGNELWNKTLGSNSYDEFSDVALGNSGKVYAVGYTYGVIDDNSYAGQDDGLIVSYDTNGTKQWSRTMGAGSGERLNGVTVDNAENVYAVGYTNGVLDGQTYGGGYSDGLIVKYDSNGNKLWTRLLGTNDWDQLNDVGADQSGNIYVVGYSKGSFQGQINAGSQDILIAKFDTNGNQLWVRLLGSALSDEAFAIAVDASSIYVVGQASASLEGQVHKGTYDAVMAKYDTNGNKIWTRLTASSFGSYSDYFLTVAANSSGIYAGGVYTTNTYWYGVEPVVVKYDSNGNKVKELLLLGTTQEEDPLQGVGIDATGNVYGTGIYRTTFRSPNPSHSFIVKYAPSSFAGVKKLTTIASLLEAVQSLLKQLKTLQHMLE